MGRGTTSKAIRKANRSSLKDADISLKSIEDAFSNLMNPDDNGDEAVINDKLINLTGICKITRKILKQFCSKEHTPRTHELFADEFKKIMDFCKDIKTISNEVIERLNQTIEQPIIPAIEPAKPDEPVERVEKVEIPENPEPIKTTEEDVEIVEADDDIEIVESGDAYEADDDVADENVETTDVVKTIENTETADEIAEIRKEFLAQNIIKKKDKVKIARQLSIYNYIKDSHVINNMIVLCGNLIKYNELDDVNNLTYSFAINEPGIDLNILPFCEINFKIVFVDDDDVSETEKKYILTLLHILKSQTKIIYDIITSPNIDVKEFSNVIMGIIPILRKRIPRCDRAFDHLANSASILENNFGKYYKDIHQSGDPSMLIQNFVMDVADNVQDDSRLISELRTIVEFHRKQLNKGDANINPQLKSMFGVVDKAFKAIDDNGQQQ